MYNRYIKSQQFNQVVFAKTEIVKPNEIVDLSRLDYYERVLGNNKDYFFIIIFDEKDQNGNEAVKIAKALKTLVDTKSYQGFNVYTMNRNTLDKINQIMEKGGDPIPFGNNKKAPIEIYLKTPHSSNFLSFKFKSNRFFEQRSLKKFGKKIEKMKNLIQIVDNEEELLDQLFHSSQKFGEVLVIRCVEDASSMEAQKLINSYSKAAYFCMEKKILSRKSNFLLITNKKLISKYALDKDYNYVYRNDLIQAYESISGKQLEDKSNYLRIENPNLSNYEYYLDKLPPHKSGSLLGVALNEDKEFIKRREEEETSRFMDFITHRMLLLKDSKDQSVGKALKKSLRDKSKYTLSLYLPKSDPQHQKKIDAFMELYRKYNDKFTFILIEKDFLQDLLPHINNEFSDFVAYNILHQFKGYENFKNYFKPLVFPYRKFFLRSSSSAPLSFDELDQQVQKFLRGELEECYLNAMDGAIQTLKSDELKTIFNYSKLYKRPILLSINDSTTNTQSLDDALRHIVTEDLGKTKSERLILSKTDTQNSMRYFGNIVGNSLLFYNPIKDAVFTAYYPQAKSKEEEIREWIYNFISESSK